MQALDWKKYTILIAEDYEPSYRFLQEIIATTGAAILWAKDGQETIDMVKKNKVDLILMDIKMPKLFGHNALKEIKKFNRDVPVIATTAYAIKEYEDMCYETGFDNYISKPLDIRKLFTIMGKYLN